jgi:hypothetical protein
LQKNSDDVFHIASLLEIISFINREDVRSVPAMTPTQNQSPIIEAGSSFHIPKQTPFVLTARANDSNGDKLSFSWEELDLGREGPPNDDDQDVRPIFRSFMPDTTGSRIFPRLSDLLNGGPSFGEVLPARSRTLNFRVTVRDNRSGGGAFSSRTEQVSILSDNGSFAITQPTRTSVWAPGSTQRVTWDVAETSAAPINCLNVRISISTDGGKSFTILTESTPNNGEAVIVVPNTPTTMARIKVEAIANIFFSLSPGNFKIASTTE